MSAFPSTAFADTVLDLIKDDTPFLALYTSNPGPTNTGAEASGGSYARQAITLSAASGAATSNTNEIVFTGLPGATITHWGIFNASTSGDFLAYGAINSQSITETGDDLIFAIGAIDLNMSGS
jgi:hypothetical protein